MFYFTGRHTESTGTNIVEVCPAIGIQTPVLRGFSVANGGTDQSLYVLSPLGIFETDQFVSAGDTTTRVTSVSPGRDSDGSSLELAEDDVVVAINRFGQYELLLVASVSGDTVTWSAGPTSDLLHRSLLYSFYNPVEEGISKFPPVDASVTQPGYDIPAGETVTQTNAWYVGGRTKQQDSVAVTAAGCPMVVILTNNTNAAVLEWCSFTWVDSSETITPDSETLTGGDADKQSVPPVEEGK